MSELRKRMIEDMQLAGLAQPTQKAYIRAMRRLAGHFHLSPDRLTEGQVRDYIMYLRNVRGIAKGTFQHHFYAFKFFYINTLDYDWPLLTKKKFAIRIRSVFPTFAATRIAAA